MKHKKGFLPESGARRVVSIVLIALCAALALSSAAGFVLRLTGQVEQNLLSMRVSAVLHAASGGIVDSIALEAKGAKLKELRARPDFRSMGQNEIESICELAEREAREAAEALYSRVEGADDAAFEGRIGAIEAAMAAYKKQERDEKAEYSKHYMALVSAVPDFSAFVEERDDEALMAAIADAVPALSGSHLLAPLADMARARAAKQEEREDQELYDLLLLSLMVEVQDWENFSKIKDDDEELWCALLELLPDLNEGERFQADILRDARARISGESGDIETSTVQTEIAAAQAEKVDERYFKASDALNALKADADAAYALLWDDLTSMIPDLTTLNRKMQNTVRDNIMALAEAGGQDFAKKYAAYAAQGAADELKGTGAFAMWLSASAGQMLLGAIAALLFALVYIFWTPLTGRLGVPRTIITLFFIYLCLLLELYNMSIPLMLGNVLERVGMYGVLVLAMLPGIQCGIGLNMGMTIGCISGLFAIVLALQYNLTGLPALVFSCVVGAGIAVPLGWAYAKLLNRMKGNEMTISTYVGFSFVSLMCIGWMLIPFDNPKIIWLLCGRGLRVTHSLLGSFAHVLDRLLAFDLAGAQVPTGLLIFFLVCCGGMWLFSRSKTGVAMTAVGSNPRFAEASGIKVNRMRTVGTVISTVIAAIGIVIYSQAFGYAQLYTAPRQLGFIAASAILIGGATVSRAKVGHVIIGVFLFEGVLALGQQIANAAVAGGGLSEVMRIMISNGIILYALTQSGGKARG